MESKSFREDVAARATIAVVGGVFLALGLTKTLIFYLYGGNEAYRIVSLLFNIAMLLFLVCGVIVSRRLRKGYYRLEQRANASPAADFLAKKPNTVAFLIMACAGLIVALAYIVMPAVMNNARLAPLVHTLAGIALGVIAFLVLFYFYRQNRDGASSGN